MYTVDNKNVDKDLTGMAARFIAETNAFLDLFWAHPSARWPMKLRADAAAGGESPPAAAPEQPCPNVPLLPTMFGDVAAIPELVARVQRIRQPAPDGGDGTSAPADAEPRVYVLLVLVPEEPPCPSTESILAATGLRAIHPRNGKPVCVDAPPPPAALPNKQPRRRCRAPSAA